MSTNTSDEVIIEFKYTRDEYISAVQAYQRRAIPVSLYVGGAVLVVGAILLLVFYGSNSRVMIGVTFFLLLLFSLSLGFFFGPRKEYNRSTLAQITYWFRFSNEGVEFRGDEDRAAMSPWSLYNAVWELDTFYFLFQAEEDAFTIIPKRAFTDVSQEQRFRGLLQRYVAPEYEWGPE